MGKLRNKLYPDPDKAKEHEKGAKVVITQPIRVDDIKFMTRGVVMPSNLYLNIAQQSEAEAVKILEEILLEVRTSKKDTPFLQHEEYFFFGESYKCYCVELC